MENKVKLKGYKLNPNYTPSVGDYFHIADWDYGEIEELVAMTPKSWWYRYESKLKYGFEGEDFILFSSGTFGTATEDYIPWSARRIFKSDILVPAEEAPVYNPENIVVTWGDVVIEDFSDVVFIPQPKKEKPLKYTELWMADTSNDTLDTTMGYLTNGEVYDVLSSSFIRGSQQFEVVCDNGYVCYFHNGWFKPVRLYDEDESELICRDIEFVEGDYIDLRKHTPEQILHIAKFYPFFDINTLYSHVYEVVMYNTTSEFEGQNCDEDCTKEYTYGDIFYSEES